MVVVPLHRVPKASGSEQIGLIDLAFNAIVVARSGRGWRPTF
jgi:hypothetical protein